MKGLFAVVVTCAALGSISASAHHSLAAYTLSSFKTIEGTVKSFEWANPHAKLYLSVTDTGGHVVNWNFEGGSIGRLTNGGFKRDMMAPGDKIKVAYNPRRDNGVGGFFIAVITADGTTYSVDRYKELTEKGKQE